MSTNLFLDPQKDAEQLAELAALLHAKELKKTQEMQSVRTDRDANNAKAQTYFRGIDVTQPLSAQDINSLNQDAGRIRTTDRILENSPLKDIDFDRS